MMHTFFVGGVILKVFESIFETYSEILTSQVFFDSLSSIECSNERERIFQVCSLLNDNLNIRNAKN